MAVEKLITTAGQALIAQALAGTGNLDDMTVVVGEGRSSPGLADTGVETPLSPATSYDADYAVVSADGVFQIGAADTTVDGADGTGGTSFRGSEFAVMKDSTCVARVVETNAANFYEKPANASWSANFSFDAENPTAGTVEVDISHFDGIAARGRPGRVPINTEEQFAQRASGIFVPLTSEIPDAASADDIEARTGTGFVRSDRLPLPPLTIISLPASRVTGTNIIAINPVTALSSLDFGLAYRIIAPNNATNNVTIRVQVNGSNVDRELWIDRERAGSGSIRQTYIYDIFYDGSRWHVIGSNTEFLPHNHFVTPIAISPVGGSLSWNVGTAPIARTTIAADTTLAAFTGGRDGGFYELIVTATGAARDLVLSGTYKRGNTPTPAAISAGRTSYLMFQQDGTSRIFLGERSGYQL